MKRSYQVGDIVLGNWKLVRAIGEGSYGKVYEAERIEFGMRYTAAIKIISVPQSQSEVISARAEGMDEVSVTSYFRSIVEDIVQEFGLMSKLKGHSNVVSYEDHAVLEHTEGIGWDILIRMELLTPLLTYSQIHKLTQQDVIRLGIDICKALELCQRYNIVHRDIKPENIFISQMGEFKLGDFGIARTVDRTMGGLSKKGTYTYMAPEVYKEEPYNSTVDIYSLGIVLYRLLNDNRTPFLPTYPAPITYRDREAAMVRRMSGEMVPTISNIDSRLSNIVLKACSYYPNARYSSPTQMRMDLEAVLNGVSISVNYVSESERTVVDCNLNSYRKEDNYTQDIQSNRRQIFGTISSVGKFDTVSEDGANPITEEKTEFAFIAPQKHEKVNMVGEKRMNYDGSHSNEISDAYAQNKMLNQEVERTNKDEMVNTTKKNIVLPFAIVGIAVIAFLLLRKNDNETVYPKDDPEVHVETIYSKDDSEVQIKESEKQEYSNQYDLFGYAESSQDVYGGIMAIAWEFSSAETSRKDDNVYILFEDGAEAVDVRCTVEGDAFWLEWNEVEYEVDDGPNVIKTNPGEFGGFFVSTPLETNPKKSFVIDIDGELYRYIDTR